MAGMVQSAAVPDLTRLDHDGNPRGSRALNLQTLRSSQDRVASGTNSIAVGRDTKASGNGGVAIGVSAEAAGWDAAAIGAYAIASGDESAALGYDAKAKGQGSVALGSGLAYGQASFSFRHRVFPDKSIMLSGFSAIPADDWSDHQESNSSAFRVAFATPYVDLGPVPDWAPAVTHAHGDCVKPTARGDVQYRVWAAYEESNPTHEAPVSKAAEPTWPGAGGSASVNTSGSSAWIGIDWAAGYETEAIPNWLTFFPVEILFVCHDYTESSGLPAISIGTPANPTVILDAEPVTITATGQSFRFPIPNPAQAVAAGESVLIKIVASATAGKILGRFLLSGYFIEGPARY